MKTRTPMMTGAAAAVLLAAQLAGCAPQQFRSGTVHDGIGAELKQATAERGARDAAADKALLPPLAAEMPKAPAGPAAEPRFDLSVLNAPAQQVFMAIVTGTRYNMLVPQDVGGTITINLKDVTVREALDAIRELYGYEYAVKGNRITVQSNAMQTRIFRINYLASRRQGSSELRVISSSVGSSNSSASGATSSGSSNPQSGQTPTSSLTSRVRTETDADFWTSLNTALTAIVGNADGRKVVTNPQSGIVVISALPREIRQVESYLRATQAVVDRQVMLEAKILDVALSQGFQAGINWSAFRSGGYSQSAIGVAAPGTTLRAAAGTAADISNASVTVTPGQFGSVVATALGNGFTGLALQTSNFAALLNFLEEQGTVTVLSSPRIATINNQKAVLKVGDDELFVTGLTTTTTTNAAGGNVTTPTLTLQAYFSGISLDVTPQIDEDNNIVLHIHPAVSVVREKEKVVDLGQMGVYQLPLATSSVNETDSIVRVSDGNIVAIGGLMAQSQTQDRSQVPGLGSLPGVGYLFGQRANTGSKRELVILLKPTVITSDRAWLQDLDGTSERVQKLDPRQFMGGDR